MALSLTDVQAALARLLTDNAAREAFLAAPEATGATWHLTAREIAHLHQMAAQGIPEFAASLRAKRRAEAGELLPLTRQALGDKYAALFDEHTAQFTPQGIHKPYEDALEFLEFLQQPDRDSWLCELARFEAINVRARQSRCQIALFQFALRELTGDNPAQARRKLSLACWFNGRLRIWEN